MAYISKIKLPSGDTYDIKSDTSDKMDKTNPTGTGAFSLNRKADTTVGNYSVAIGKDCESTGIGSYAEGYGNVAVGDYGSHAEGNNCNASGNSGSHAEGINCTAYGTNGSHAEGNNCFDMGGDGSHTEGLGCQASGGTQHVQGKYNKIYNGIYCHIVGNGTSSDDRSNCHTLDWNGNAWYSGDVTVGSDATRLAKITEISNPNLLINPDFKINQRGKTRYDTSGACVYCVDRWKLFDGYWASVGEESLGIVTGVPHINAWCISQSIENYQALKGQTITFTVKCSTGADCFGILVNDGGTQTGKSLPFGMNQIVSVTHTVSENATGLHVVFSTNGNEGVNALFYPHWAKLEIGSVATPFVPPNPTTELIKCKRYFEAVQWMKDLSVGHAFYGDTSHFIFTHTLVPKRANPSITYDDISNAYINGCGINNGANVSSVMYIGVAYNTSNVFQVQLALTGNLTTQMCYANDTMQTKFVYVDAEMY